MKGELRFDQLCDSNSLNHVDLTLINGSFGQVTKFLAEDPGKAGSEGLELHRRRSGMETFGGSIA